MLKQSLWHPEALGHEVGAQPHAAYRRYLKQSGITYGVIA